MSRIYPRKSSSTQRRTSPSSPPTVCRRRRLLPCDQHCVAAAVEQPAERSLAMGCAPAGLAKPVTQDPQPMPIPSDKAATLSPTDVADEQMGDSWRQRAPAGARRAATRFGSIRNPIAGNASYMLTYGLSEMAIESRAFRPVRAHRRRRIHRYRGTYLATMTPSPPAAPKPICPRTSKIGWTSLLHKQCFGHRSSTDTSCAAGRPITSRP